MTIAQINLETLQALVMHEPLVLAGKQFGDPGSARMKGILRFLKLCARHATVHERSNVTVFALMQSDPLVESVRSQHATAFQFGTTALGSIQDLAVEIREDGSPFIWQVIPPQITSIIETGIVYRLVQSVETFSISGNTVAVPKVIEDAVSQFLLNYFKDLRQALLAYRDSMARTSKCHLLREAWADDNRLWFRTKPEYRLRKALHNYLYSYLRHDDIDLREEQNVDDSHPVDIKILWRMENRTAIIEVKWHRQQAAKEDTRGYLVAFDCRRKQLKASTKTVARAEGFHYQAREITYRPEFHKRRQDFDEPMRMFL